MWKAVNADYKIAVNKFPRSGTHDSDFFPFCSGKIETYYLRKYLCLCPNLTATVEADLPVECAVASEGFSTSTSSTISTGFNENKKGQEAMNLRMPSGNIPPELWTLN